MAFDFLVPIKDKVLAYSELLPPQSLGKSIHKHTEQKGFPVFANATVAIFGVLESRNAVEKKPSPLDVDEVRIQLYRLMKGNWGATILDIGDVEEGETVEDTYFVVKEIVAGLLEEKIIPIIIGATQDITFPTYRAFDKIKDMVNLVSIDSRFDFGQADELISSNSYMSKIITDKPNNLFNFSNLGFQSYFNAQEELDLMERLFFDAYRLGDVAANLSLAEPVLRNAHIVSLDLTSIRASEMGMGRSFSPNGFTGREICSIARYAGLSDSVSLFGIYEGDNSHQGFQMIAQIIWYFLEGITFRVKEHPTSQSEDFTKFTVPTDTEELIFYKSHVTERWWVEVPSILPEHTKTNSPALLPCTEEDYLEACNQNIPERWFKAYRKGLN
ncbi:formimidoylglutamase [Flagellimonas meridianipacifica]|uniref:Arginase family enzyme n=1 Tax=Flagellimonas meridianipacifica TaxID=1080225 RepID=A0A2T0MFH3_9FLAO|nr:formimidoylglutamase [Allomuricauda pacifica]PRX56323.1 arginase family enzyme [Allomuricauda pacifica]